MAASYKKLFKLLIDRDMKKKELAERAGISIATITKMGKDGAVVSSDVLVKICAALECTMDDIVEIVPDILWESARYDHIKNWGKYYEFKNIIFRR